MAGTNISGTAACTADDRYSRCYNVGRGGDAFETIHPCRKSRADTASRVHVRQSHPRRQRDCCRLENQFPNRAADDTSASIPRGVGSTRLSGRSAFSQVTPGTERAPRGAERTQKPEYQKVKRLWEQMRDIPERRRAKVIADREDINASYDAVRRWCQD